MTYASNSHYSEMPPVSGGHCSFGEQIEDYEVLNLLGKGGFASVYRSRCLKTGIEVAIKMIDKKLMQAAGMVGRVRQEVAIHSRLKHPSVLELYTFFEDMNYVYLVLELCHNGELQRYLKNNAVILDEEEASHLFRQVVQGLLYLHSHNILHRDISLANLLLSKDMRVKIADFGLATQLSRADEKHLTMCGTPNYISPEVATRSSHGLEADVWGLGCLLYTLLVGRPPFDTDGVKSTLTKVVMADYKIPSHLSVTARDLIDALLKKNPKERIQLQNILDHPFMKRSCVQDVLQQNCLPGDSADSGMGTMSTNTHSQATRGSFQTTNEQISIDTLPSAWKCHPTGVYKALKTDMQFNNNKEIMRNQTVTIISRPEEKFHGTDSSGKLKRPEYHHARLNHASSNGEESNFALLPTHPSVHTSNLQRSLSLLHIEDKANSVFQTEYPSCANENTVTVSNRGDKCFDGDFSCCIDSGKRAVPSDLVLGNKPSVDSSHHGDCHSCTSHHNQCSCKQNCRKCSDDEGRMIQETHTGTCSHQTSDSCQNSILRSACACQNHVTGLNKEKEDHVKVLQNSEATKNCLIRTHSAENVTRNNVNSHRSNCDCSVESFSLTKMQLHAANSEQFQKYSQPRCCRKICEHSKGADIVNVKHFSSVKCNAHSDDKAQDCKARNCLHHTHSLDNPPMLQHSVKHQQGSYSHPTLQETGCHRSLNDTNVYRVGYDGVFKKRGVEFTRQVESAGTVRGTDEAKTNANCVTHSPLSSLRLQPTRHRTKGAILSILESGEVCIEFLRKRNGNREEKVVDVCRISGDGLRVVLYRPNGGRGCSVGDSPPALPEEGADAIYSFESLPAKHWKKYLYASRFVNLVKAKTPKVTFYSDKAKCLLMENDPDPDFEVCFYEGGKITKVSGECIKIIDSSGHSTVLENEKDEHSLPASTRLLWDHFQQCYRHCMVLEENLTQISKETATKGANCFPIIVGKRPSLFGGKENVANIKPEKHVSHMPELCSFDVSLMSTNPTKHCGSSVQHGQNISPASRGTSPSASVRPSPKERRVVVPGIGTAVQLPSGEMQVHHGDGSVVTINSASGAVQFQRPEGQILQYGEKDVLPDDLKIKLVQIPKIVRYLMQTETKIKSPVLIPRTRVVR